MPLAHQRFHAAGLAATSDRRTAVGHSGPADFIECERAVAPCPCGDLLRRLAELLGDPVPLFFGTPGADYDLIFGRLWAGVVAVDHDGNRAIGQRGWFDGTISIRSEEH